MLAAVEGETRRPPHVGNALTISAIDDPVSWFVKRVTWDVRNDLPKVKHMVAPRIQHHVAYMGITLMGSWKCMCMCLLTH